MKKAEFEQKIKELLSDGKLETAINILTSYREQKSPDIERLKKEFDPNLHAVNDKINRPDKEVVIPGGGRRIEKVVRTPIPWQHQIVDKAVSFTFGIPPILNAEPQDDTEQLLVDAVNRVLFENKIDSLNREIAENLYKSTQVAEFWYPYDTGKIHNAYGFPTRFKFKVMYWTPWTDDELTPIFDEYDNMVSFTRSYIIKDILDDGKTINAIDTYTDKEIISFRKEDGKEWEYTIASHTLGKIPIVYGEQPLAEWEIVQKLIERKEEILSDLGDTNLYHAYPTLFLSGEVKGLPKKGERGKVLQGTGDKADAKYIEAVGAAESLRLEIEELDKAIKLFSQTPDISFDALKGIGQIATETLRMLFLDAHLKVQKKRTIFDAYLQRRINIIVAYLSSIHAPFKSIDDKFEIVPEIQPFMVTSEKDLINFLMTANGGQAILSQETSITQSGLVTDTKNELARINSEIQARETRSIIEPTE